MESPWFSTMVIGQSSWSQGQTYMTGMSPFVEVECRKIVLSSMHVIIHFDENILVFFFCQVYVWFYSKNHEGDSWTSMRYSYLIFQCMYICTGMTHVISSECFIWTPWDIPTCQITTGVLPVDDINNTEYWILTSLFSNE